MRFPIYILVFFVAATAMAEPVTVTLWPAGAPQPSGFQAAPETEVKRKVDDGLRRITNVAEPTMTLYMPGKPNGTAVLVCPGGGYNLEYKKHNRPAELHIYTKGNHGFGMKKTGIPADGWPTRAGDFSNFIPRTGNIGLTYSRLPINIKINMNYRGQQKTGTVGAINGFRYYAARKFVDVNAEYRIRVG